MAACTRRNASQHLRRFHKDSAGAAHRVEQRHAWLPAAAAQQAGSKVFAQRRCAGLAAPAALEQRFAGSVEIDSEIVCIEEAGDTHVRHSGVDRWPFVEAFAETVTDGVLDFQCDKFKTAQ